MECSCKNMLVFLNALLFCIFVSCEASKNYPQAIVHIGPSKTGTTTIQHGIMSSKRELEARGWYLLRGHTGNEVERQFKSFYDETNEDNFFRQALQMNHNIIISCEKLGSYEDLSLYAGVLQHFNTSIIMFYREFLSMHVSYYYQQRMHQSFLEYLTSEEIHLRSITSGTGGYEKRIELWEELGSIVVVDYDGVVAGGTSLQYLFLCDIAGVACLDKLRINEVYNPTHVENIREQIIQRLFSSYAHARGCGIDFKHFTIDTRDIPLIQRDFSHLVLYSKLLDEQFRQKYGSKLLYSNATASRIAAERYRYHDEVDIAKVLLSPIWQAKLNEWIDKEIILHKAKCKEIHNAGPYRYKPSPNSVLNISA